MILAQNEMLFGYGDGYEAIEIAKRKGWRVASAWGLNGWDLGSWPLVSVHLRERDGRFEVAEYVEGDVTIQSFATEAERTEVIDDMAFRWWTAQREPWVEGLSGPTDEMRGPFSWARLNESKA